MLVELKFFLFFLLLNVPPTLPKTLEPVGATLMTGTATESNDLVPAANVEENKLDVTTPKKIKVNELIQQIDVKDEQNQVKTNVKQVIVSNDSTNSTPTTNSIVKLLNNNTEINDGFKGNDTNNIVLNNTLATKRNKLGDQNNYTTDSIESTHRMALNEENSNIINTTIDVVSNKSNIPIQNTNVKDTDISWRLDLPKNKYQNVINTQVNSNLDIANYTKDFKDNLSANDEDQRFILEPNDNQTRNVFVIINSGNIEGFSVNSPITGSNLTADELVQKINNSIDINAKSKLIRHLINSKQNSVAPNLLKQNINNLNSKNTFWILNSGDILNFRLNSPILDVPKNDKISKDRFRRNLNDITENPENTGNLKTPIVDLKFRKDENSHKNKDNISASTVPLKVDNSSYELNSNDTHHIKNNSTKDKILEENVENVVSIPDVFKNLITNLKTNSDQDLYPIASTSNPNLNNNNNKILQPLSQLKQVGLDINNFDIFGNTFDLIKRLKRDAVSKSIHWKTNHRINFFDDERYKKIDELCTSNKNCLNKDWSTKILKSSYGAYNDDEKEDRQIKSSRLSNRAGNNDVESDDFVNMECPVSIIVKIGFHQVLRMLSESKNVIIATIYPIINSILEDDTNPINFATLDLLDHPFTVKLRVQLLHGSTSDFINELSNYIDTTLCKFTES